MVPEGMTFAEGFSTFPTLIGPFFHVNSPVSDEALALAKGFPTFTASVTSVSIEDSLLMNKFVFVPQSFCTF